MSVEKEPKRLSAVVVSVDPRPIRLRNRKVFALATLDLTYGAYRRSGYGAVRLVKPGGESFAVEAHVEWPHAPGVDPPCVVGINVPDGLGVEAGDVVEFSASGGGAT